jgi:hypothetical protein
MGPHLQRLVLAVTMPGLRASTADWFGARISWVHHAERRHALPGQADLDSCRV